MKEDDDDASRNVSNENRGIPEADVAFRDLSGRLLKISDNTTYRLYVIISDTDIINEASRICRTCPINMKSILARCSRKMYLVYHRGHIFAHTSALNVFAIIVALTCVQLNRKHETNCRYELIARAPRYRAALYFRNRG